MVMILSLGKSMPFNLLKCLSLVNQVIGVAGNSQINKFIIIRIMFNKVPFEIWLSKSYVERMLR